MGHRGRGVAQRRVCTTRRPVAWSSVSVEQVAISNINNYPRRLQRTALNPPLFFFLVCSSFRALFRSVIYKYPTQCTSVFMMYFIKMFSPVRFDRYCGQLQFDIVTRIQILVIMSNWSWQQYRSKRIGENILIKYIINTEVHFVGYLYTYFLIFCWPCISIYLS